MIISSVHQVHCHWTANNWLLSGIRFSKGMKYSAEAIGTTAWIPKNLLTIFFLGRNSYVYSTLKAGKVVQWGKTSAYDTDTSYWSADSSPGCPASDLAPCSRVWESSKGWPNCLGLCHQRGDPDGDWGSCLGMAQLWSMQSFVEWTNDETYLSLYL